ncbi:MAG: AAA family ATPase [Candidatus Woesearchaeota archaeon]
MKIFQEMFKHGSGQIPGTSFTHGESNSRFISMRNQYSKKANLAKPLGSAIMSFFNDSIRGIGVTNNKHLYIIMDSTSSNDEYHIVYDLDDTIALYSSNSKFDISTVNKLMFVPFIVDAFLFKKDNEFMLKFDALKSLMMMIKNTKNTNIINSASFKEAFFVAHDALYFLYKDKDVQIVNTKLNEIVTQDYTDKFLERRGDFNSLGQKNNTKKNKPKLKNKPKKIRPNSSGAKFNWEGDMSDEYKDLIPKVPDYIKVPEICLPVEKSIASKKTVSVLLRGPAGVGKSTTVKAICRDIGLPLVETINCTNALDEYVLGKWQPREKKSDGDTDFVFYKSRFAEAIKNGGAICLEEINFGNPKHLSFLNSLLDINEFVHLDNGEKIERSPNFRLFATMNFRYAGTSRMNRALISRFDAKVFLDDLTDEELFVGLRNESEEDDVTLKKIIKVYRKIQEKIEEEGREEEITPRDIINWAKQIPDSNATIAAKLTIREVADEDREFAEEIMDCVKLIFK